MRRLPRNRPTEGFPQPLAQVRPRHARKSALRLVVFFSQPATDVQPQLPESAAQGFPADPRTTQRRGKSRRSLEVACAHVGPSIAVIPPGNDVCIVVQSAVSRANCLARCNLSFTTMPERLHQKQQFAGFSSVARPLRSSLPALTPPRAEANVSSRSPNKSRRAAPH